MYISTHIYIDIKNWISDISRIEYYHVDRSWPKKHDNTRKAGWSSCAPLFIHEDGQRRSSVVLFHHFQQEKKTTHSGVRFVTKRFHHSTADESHHQGNIFTVKASNNSLQHLAQNSQRPGHADRWTQKGSTPLLLACMLHENCVWKSVQLLNMHPPMNNKVHSFFHISMSQASERVFSSWIYI